MQDALRFVESCIEQYAEQAWRAAYVMLSNAADADDLLQQAFLVAWRKADAAPRDNAWPWLATIIANEARNFRRKRSRRQGVSLHSIGEPAMQNDPDKQLQRAELSALVHVSLAELGEEQRIAIVLTHLSGLSQSQAADALGIPLNTLKARVRRGLESMRDALGKHAPGLEGTLKNLQVGAPPGGFIAAKAAWSASLSANVAAAGTATSVAAGATGIKAILVTAAATVVLTVGAIAGVALQPKETPTPYTAAAINNEPMAPRSNSPEPEPVSVNRTTQHASEQPEPRPEPKPVVLTRPESNSFPDSKPGRPLALTDPENTQPQEPSSPPASTLKQYQPTTGVEGNIVSVGSDTLNNLLTLWAEGFRKHYPNIEVSVEGKGSSTAPTSLVDGTSNIGPMTRQMKSDEIARFEEKYGYEPSFVPVAIDALAVFVHKDNPIQGLSLQQVDAIFSSSRRGGGDEDISRWGQLGLLGEWSESSITLYGRNNASGTYGYFKQHALFKGDYKRSVVEQPGSAAVVQSVSTDRTAVGYCGIAYKTEGVRAVPLSSNTENDAFEPNQENCNNGKYPLARYLYIYFNRAPGKAVSPALRELFKFIHSKDGQAIVEKNGFIALNEKAIAKFTDRYEDTR
ncbi:MAG: phosphate ABC transporter substrate-binding protein PstS family protein [Planctomycetota bacterium]